MGGGGKSPVSIIALEGAVYFVEQKEEPPRAPIEDLALLGVVRACHGCFVGLLLPHLEGGILSTPIVPHSSLASVRRLHSPEQSHPSIALPYIHEYY
jgi:hypothetical protein